MNVRYSFRIKQKSLKADTLTISITHYITTVERHNRLSVTFFFKVTIADRLLVTYLTFDASLNVDKVFAPLTNRCMSIKLIALF